MSRMKYLAATVSVVALLTGEAEAAASITIAATPMAANAVTDLVADFLADSPPELGYSVSVNIAPDVDVMNSIINGTEPVPDIFLAQSFYAPWQLKLHHPDRVVGNPFPYAKDPLVLYSSSATAVDISAGFPKTDIQPFAMPDPNTLDPYGLAAVSVLRSAYLKSLSKGLVTRTLDAAGAYAAVQFLGMSYGFTGKSQICTAVAGVEEFEEGSFHHEYPIVTTLAGVRVARTRTKEENAELLAFYKYMRGAGAVNFSQHCFKLPFLPYLPPAAAVGQVSAAAR